MYNVADTITAISSGTFTAAKVSETIIRISGPAAFRTLQQQLGIKIIKAPGLSQHTICPIDGIEVEATVYVFQEPASYTGQDLVELHFFAAATVVEEILKILLEKTRPAGPGEFTLRAYLNGKMDLSQAEAVAQIVAGSNRIQLAAAEKLLSGKLGRSVVQIREKLLELISLLEAGLDFPTEDIEIISPRQSLERISLIEDDLKHILNNNVRCEELIDMPAVGLAGAANAGKSSLLNALLGQRRSIVSDRKATTRDVLRGILEIDRLSCAIFDCAGLNASVNQSDILKTLAQAAAIEAINSAQLVLFCVDISKDDYTEDSEVRKLVKNENVVTLATKCDQHQGDKLSKKLGLIKDLFGEEITCLSIYDKDSLNCLRKIITKRILTLGKTSLEADGHIAITERHRSAIEHTLKNTTEAADEIRTGNDEIASMLLRNACLVLSGLEREDIDESVLKKIFSTFCIGK